MSNKQPLPTDIELTALDPVFREHPHDRLDRLRAEDPLHLDAELGRLFLTRFEDMRGVRAASGRRPMCRAIEETCGPLLPHTITVNGSGRMMAGRMEDWAL